MQSIISQVTLWKYVLMLMLSLALHMMHAVLQVKNA